MTSSGPVTNTTLQIRSIFLSHSALLVSLAERKHGRLCRQGKRGRSMESGRKAAARETVEGGSINISRLILRTNRASSLPIYRLYHHLSI